MRFHDLRHSCASVLADLGVIMPAISAQLGHSKVSTTSDIYTHVFPRTAEGYAVEQEQAILGEPAEVSSEDEGVTPVPRRKMGRTGRARPNMDEFRHQTKQFLESRYCG